MAKPGRGSRSKGKVGEREVVQRFVAAGIPARRRWEEQSRKGGQLHGDLGVQIGEDTELEVYAEVRRQETLRIPTWLREIEDKAPEGWGRALIFRRSREDWHVAIPLDDYIALLKASL